MRTPKDQQRELGAKFFLKKMYINYDGKLHPLKMIECVVVSVGKPLKKTECYVDSQLLRNINPHYPAYKVLWRDLIPYDSIKCCNCPRHCPNSL